MGTICITKELYPPSSPSTSLQKLEYIKPIKTREQKIRDIFYLEYNKKVICQKI